METVNPGLSDDFDKVASAEAAIEEIKARMLDYTASASEILQWYFAKDPIKQGFYENLGRTVSTFDTDLFKSQILRDGQTAEVMEKGAAALAVSVLMPVATQGGETDWYPAVSAWCRDEYDLDDSAAELPASDIILFTLENCSNEAMTMDDVEIL